MSEIGVIACGARKLDHAAPAKDLYVGQHFKAARRYIEARCPDGWVILSAKHGVVLPETILDPYEATVTSMPRDERARWGASARASLRRHFPDADLFIVTAGAAYREALREGMGVPIWCPWDEMVGARGIGHQKQWFKEHTP